MNYHNNKKTEHCIWLIYMELFFELDTQMWFIEKLTPHEFERRCMNLVNIIISTCMEYDIDPRNVVEYTNPKVVGARYGRPYNYNRSFYQNACRDEISRFSVLNNDLYSDVLKCVYRKQEELEKYQKSVLRIDY